MILGLKAHPDGASLPLGSPVPSLGGVCALSAAGAAVANVPCLGQCALARPRIPGESKLPRHGSDVAVVLKIQILASYFAVSFRDQHSVSAAS